MNRNLFSDLWSSLLNPSYWLYATWLEIIAKYRRSRLGIIWAIVPAVAYIWGLGLFFGGLAEAGAGKFMAHIALGVFVYRFFISAWMEGVSTFSSGKAFILDNQLRLTDLVLKVLAKACFYAFVSVPVVFSALWMSPDFAWSGLVSSAALFPLLLLNAFWMAMLAAFLGARFPDIQELMGSLMLFAFILTPIIWEASAMPAGTFRGDLMRINPLYHLVEIFRAPILGQTVAYSTVIYIEVMALVGTAVAALSYYLYSRRVALWI